MLLAGVLEFGSVGVAGAHPGLVAGGAVAAFEPVVGCAGDVSSAGSAVSLEGGLAASCGVADGEDVGPGLFGDGEEAGCFVEVGEDEVDGVAYLVVGFGPGVGLVAVAACVSDGCGFGGCADGVAAACFGSGGVGVLGGVALASEEFVDGGVVETAEELEHGVAVASGVGGLASFEGGEFGVGVVGEGVVAGAWGVPVPGEAASLGHGVSLSTGPTVPSSGSVGWQVAARPATAASSTSVAIADRCAANSSRFQFVFLRRSPALLRSSFAVDWRLTLHPQRHPAK